MLNSIMDFILRIWHSEGWTVLIELALIAGVIYLFLRFLRGTRGARLFYGLSLLFVSSFLVFTVIAEPLGWDRVRFLFEKAVYVLMLAVVVVFQPELRRAFMLLGHASLLKSLLRETNRVVDELVKAAEECSRHRIGFIVAVQRNDPLSAICDEGVAVDAVVSAELLESIFYPDNPLHDMGVVIAGGRIVAARVQFEQAEPGDVPGELGARHRAAVGLSRTCDAVVVVVSEQTGTISLVEDGKMNRHLNGEELRLRLRRALALDQPEVKKSGGGGA